MTPEQIAHIAHEANRALQRVQAEPAVPVAAPWAEFDLAQQAGVIDGVRKALAGATPEELHESWCERKLAEGWRHGPVKDEQARTHPCLVPYAELPESQRVKDRLFAAIAGALGQ